MSEWRPINTAPKDGTFILIAEGDGVWLSAWGRFYSPFYRAEIEGWWTSSDPERSHVTLPEDASYWMQIPPRPALIRPH